MRRAFSYLRCSKPEQADGRSLARQTEAAEAYCGRHGLTLDKRTFHDMGVSGFNGSNARGGELGVFIELVADGRIPRGSVLIVENTDRLSRLPPDQASALICDLVRKGVDVVTLSPEAAYTAGNLTKLGTWLPLQVSCALAPEESVKKSDRLRDMWAARRQALAGDARRSRCCPSWLRVTGDGKGFAVREDKARMVRDLFAWAAEGLGLTRLCERLQKEHPAGLRGKGWCPSYLLNILRSRAVLGEFQPHTGTAAKKGGVKKTRRPVGDAIPSYYPAVIDEGTFYKVQVGLDARRNREYGGRDKGVPNLFVGYAYDAHDGQRLVLHGDHGRRLLVSAGAVRKLPGSGWRAIPYIAFEQALLSLLAELKVEDIVGPRNGFQREAEAASAALTAVNHKITTLQAKAKDAEDPSIYFGILDQLARDRKTAQAALEQAKQKVANEGGDTLGETQGLLRLLAEAGDKEREDLRRRMKAALVRLVESMRVLPVRRHRTLLVVAVQVFFRGRGRRRDYLVAINRGSEWSCRSLADAAPRQGDLDLRKPEHARRLAEALETIDLAALAAAMSS
jgi:DNA invertase Pin-like site-specific DNA recombinase